MFEVGWEFEVRPECVDDFAAAYGPEGDWVQLFHRAPDYVGTEVKQHSLTRWTTIDRWTSRASFERFRAEHAADYEALDRRCAAFTIAERKLGETGN